MPDNDNILVHNDVIDWPNGQGFTPCTEAYRQTMDERDAICAPGNSIETLSPEDYQRWNVLDSKLADMHMNGHVGQSERI